MRKIILSLSVITIVALTAVTATRAYFTTQGSVLGNEVSSGTLTVDVDTSDSLPFSIPNLAPGDDYVTAGYFTVMNTGNLDMVFRLYVNATQNQSNIADDIKVRITLRPSSSDIYPSGFDPYGPPNLEVFEGKLSQLIGVTNAMDNGAASFINHEPLWPQYAARYQIEVGMDWDAPNAIQNKKFAGNLIVDGTQYDNQPDISISGSNVTGIHW